MRIFNKSRVVILILLFLLLISMPVDAVSDLEKEIAKRNLKRYTERYGKAKLKPRVRNKVEKIFNKLASKAEKDAPDIDFKLHVVDTKVLNAVYLGDGHVMLFEGMLKATENRNQLAAVLAHELGHGVNDDIQDSIDLIQGIRLGSLLIDYAKDGQVNQEGPGFITALSWQLLQKGFSRKQEREADRYSVFLLEESNYDPAGTIGLMKVLKAGQERVNDSELLELFSSHPNVNDRINYLAGLVSKLKAAKELYYSPIATTRRLTTGLLRNDISVIYSTYSEMVHNNINLEKFKDNEQLIKIRKKIKEWQGQYRLSYSLEIRNQVEGTARVAITFFAIKNNVKQKFKQHKFKSHKKVKIHQKKKLHKFKKFDQLEKNGVFAIDLINEEYGWKVLRGPIMY
ncbi:MULTISPECIES: M48 family metallopeptidase [unclassified Candidatus Frackibacter]|uniref:M48 family metallopeptidase n=1 Tax=unclassified Candidatus Frackibacter TaxID=2648818 RepID=UPI000B8024E4|nr:MULTISPECIES: M48 family metallopeptidase [unclassified Candidatus Frackibacter]